MIQAQFQVRLARSLVCSLLFSTLCACAQADVTYIHATRTVRAGNVASPSTFSSSDLDTFNHSVSGSAGFSPPCTASMVSNLLADRITFSGRVSASGDRNSGMDFIGQASAQQIVNIELTQPTQIQLTGSWTFVQGFSSNIAASHTITPEGSSSQPLPGSATIFAAGPYQIRTNVGSSAGPNIGITATADFSYSILFADAPSCQVDLDGSGSATIADVFAFLNAWFASDASADFNGNGLDISDIFDFLNAWLVGC